jgi:translation initiation factor 1
LETILVRLETQRRRGKTVTTLRGFTRTPGYLEALTRKIKMKCGSGGTLKDGIIEIQGDARIKIKDILLAEGFQVKGL